jgi:hypothetical protein
MSSDIKGRTSLADILKNSATTNTIIEEKIPEDIGDLMDAFCDGTKSFGQRKRYFEELRKKDNDIGREAVSNLCKSFQESGSKDLRSFICFLFDYGQLDLFQKFECALVLDYAKHESARDCFLSILKDFVATPYESRPSLALFIDVLRYLIMGPTEDRIREFIKWFMKDSKASIQFIYKTITSIYRETNDKSQENDSPIRRASKEYLDYLYLTFFKLPPDERHCILSAQYLLTNALAVDEVEGKILQIAKNNTLEHVIRADAADVLLRIGSERVKADAGAIIAELGRDMSALPTISSNRENVHLVDESVKEFLLMLGSFPLTVVQRDGIERSRSFEDVIQIIHNMPIYEPNKEKINSSLLRIQLDQLIYPGSQLLSGIFMRIFQCVEKHPDCGLLMQRLMEELIDMADTCSTGHANRLVNTFSGIGMNGLFLRIPWKDQIESNIAGRLTARAKIATDTQARADFVRKGIVPSIEELKTIDEEFREKVLGEMMNLKVEDRVHWNRFLRDVVAGLREEMLKEFVGEGHISAQDFDSFFRDGMIFYETGYRV